MKDINEMIYLRVNDTQVILNNIDIYMVIANAGIKSAKATSVYATFQMLLDTGEELKPHEHVRVILNWSVIVGFHDATNAPPFDEYFINILTQKG